MAERDQPYDPTAGLTPEEWITGVQEFLVGLQAAQEQSQGTSTAEDVGRGLAANTIGLAVPPLRERALRGMSPVGQVLGEVLNPANLPAGGAEAAMVVPLLGREGRTILNLSDMVDNPRGFPPVIMGVKPHQVAIKDYSTPNPNSAYISSVGESSGLFSPLQVARVDRNPIEHLVDNAFEASGSGWPLRVNKSGEIDVEHLVDWARSNSMATTITDPLVRGSHDEVRRRLDHLAQMPNRNETSSQLGTYLLNQPAVSEKEAKLWNARFFEDVPPPGTTAAGAAGQAWSSEAIFRDPRRQVTTTVRGGQTPPATGRTLIHETGHAIHGQFEPNMRGMEWLLGNLTGADRMTIHAELGANIRKLNPKIKEGSTGAGYDWLADPGEQFAEGLTHIIVAPDKARVEMPNFVRLIEDFSASKLATDTSGTARRLPLEFGGAVAGILMAQEALSGEGEGEGAQ